MLKKGDAEKFVANLNSPRSIRKINKCCTYPLRHAFVAQAQCTLLGDWRDCKNPRCRRAKVCLVPQPCYWERKFAMAAEQQAKAEKLYRPVRALLAIGSGKGSEGLWLF
jgi:hypothetical protein